MDPTALSELSPGAEKGTVWGQESHGAMGTGGQGTGQPQGTGAMRAHGYGDRRACGQGNPWSRGQDSQQQGTGVTTAWVPGALGQPVLGTPPDPSFSQFLPPSLPSLQWFHRRGCPCAGIVQCCHPTADLTPCPHPQQHEPREHWWHWWHWCDELWVLRAGPGGGLGVN